MNLLFVKRRGLKSLLFSGLLFMGVCFWGCGAAPSQEPEEPLEPIVKIVAGDMTGSGVLYDKTETQLIIVTAGHVLEQVSESGEPAEIIFGDNYSLKTASYVLSQTSETAFISISLDEIPEEYLKKYEPALVDKEKFDALADGDEIVLKGGQTGVGELQYAWIYVEDFQQYMMLIKGESFPGMSGGGAFDREGYLLGILCGVNDAGETAAVPLNVILAEYIQMSQM